MAKILKIRDNIVTIVGKEKFKLFTYYELDKNTNGILLSANEQEAKVLVIGDASQLKVNKSVKLLPDKNIEIKDSYFGSIINIFGDILFPKNKIGKSGKVLGTSTLFNPAPSIIDRSPLNEPLETGMLAIDTMIPIGRGQRELIIGNRSSGKSTIAINTIINQKHQVKSIYVSIGQKHTAVSTIHDLLESHGALDNTIILYANSNSAAEQFLAPMFAMALAEGIAYKGEPVLVVIDDLSKHANIYREISLSIDRNPGRESYPNDIFYLHSRLLERGGKFNQKYKNGSITILPIVELVEGDLTSLIPSNIISITDGQIFTDSDKFNKSEFPAIDVQLSVSRTGSVVQSDIIKFMSSGLKGDHARFAEIKKMIEMSIEVNDHLAEVINESKQLDKIIIQRGNIGYTNQATIFLLALYKQKSLNGDYNIREFSNVVKNYLEKDIVGKEIDRLIKSINSKNVETITKMISVSAISLVEAARGNFNNSLSKKEWENLQKGGE